MQRTTAALSTPTSRSLHTSSARNGAAEAGYAANGNADGAGKGEHSTASADTASSESKLPPNITYQNEHGVKIDATSSEVHKGESGEAAHLKSDKKAKKAKKAGKPKKPKGNNDTRSEDSDASKETQKAETNDPSKDKKASKKNKRKDTAKVEDEDDKPAPAPKEPWMIQKKALKEKFPEGWKPRKKLSPDAIAGIKALHARFPEDYTTEVLAQKFEVSPEAIRRILKSKWTPSPEEEEKRQERWFNRGKRVWAYWAALGKKPPRRWRAEGIVRDPKWNRPRSRNPLKPFDREAAARAEWRLSESMLG